MMGPGVTIVIVFVLTTISGQLLEVAKAVSETDGNFEAAFQGKRMQHFMKGTCQLSHTHGTSSQKNGINCR